MMHKFLIISTCFGVCSLLLITSAVFGQAIEDDLDSLNSALLATNNPEVQAEILLEAGKLLLRTDPDSAIAIYGRVEALSPANSVNTGLALAYQGLAHTYRGEHDISQERLVKAMEVAQLTDDYDLKTIVFGNNAIGCFYRGDYDCALTQFESFLSLAQAEAHTEDIAIASNNIGLLNLNMGNYYKAYDGLLIAAQAAPSQMPINSPNI